MPCRYLDSYVKTHAVVIPNVLSKKFHVKQVDVELRKLDLVVPRETI